MAGFSNALLISTGPRPSIEAIYEYVAGILSPGFLVSAVGEFSFVLLFAAGVLAVGHFGKWPPAYLPIPILVWAFKMAAVQLSWFANPHSLGGAYFVGGFVEGLVALVAVLALVALAVAIRSAGRACRLDLFAWISGLLAVSTVILDWVFILLMSTPFS